MVFTKTFKQISKLDTSIAGGKGASLGEMTRAGIPVPPGFVVLVLAFEEFLRENNLNDEIESIINELREQKNAKDFDKYSEVIRNSILKNKFPEKFGKEILSVFDKLKAKYVAVRSSATAEDSKLDAWAGQLESYLYVERSNLLKNVQQCWASLYTPRALFYRIEKGLTKKRVSVAVVVQKMISPEVSGVCFTVHPVTKDRSQMIIEAGFGIGEALVQGIITPDSYIIENLKSQISNLKTTTHNSKLKILDINVSKQEKMIVRSENGTKIVSVPKNKQEKQKLSGKQIIQLAEICLKIEKHYKIPQDVEWTLEKNNFYIVQSRPITTL